MNSGKSDAAGATVWVIDDDETVRLMAQEVLTAEGFQVQTFGDARPALAAFGSGFPDVLVLDVMLPTMNGFEFCARLRRTPAGQDLPVLMMTSLDDPESVNRAYEAGATDFATKPVNWTIETRRLRYLLRTSDVAAALRVRERETRLVKEEWEQTFHSIKDVVMVFDRESRVVRANAAAAAGLAKPLDRILGEACRDLLGCLPESCGACPITHTRQSGKDHELEVTFPRIGREWLVSAAPVTDADGSVTRVVCVGRDLTEQKLLEYELRQAQKMEAIGTLAGGIAHDFNNLLQVILGYTQLLAANADPLDGDAGKLQTISRAAERGAALTRQLLAFSRRGALASEKRPVALNQVVQDVLGMLERMIPKSVTIRTSLAAPVSSINADPVQMEQVLMNLTVNAAQAMPGGGCVRIETQEVTVTPEFSRRHPVLEARKYVTVSVSDTGLGMDRKTVERVYEPFFTTKDVGQGTGLGLSVVYAIVREHGGYILCRSEVGVGTTFVIYLPALACEVAPPAETKPVESHPAPRSQTIMIVDDEDMLRNLLEECLVEEGYRVISVGTGESALTRYRDDHDRPHLVVLDLGMPGMSGWDCLAALRQLDPQANVLLATGYGGDDIQRRANQEGAAGIVFKPYQFAELCGKIRDLLREPEPSLPAPPPCSIDVAEAMLAG